MSETESLQSATAAGRLTGMTVTVPSHVVFRAFAVETVVLNVNTGQYHGLNPVAGRMLETLQGTPSLETAARKLADEFEQPMQQIERDLRVFCEELASRGLLEVDVAGAD